MRSIKDHSGIRVNLLRAFLDIGDKVLCSVADAIGLVVAEIRMTILPGIKKTFKSSSSFMRLVAARRSATRIQRVRPMSEAVKRQDTERRVIVHLPINNNSPEKKYTYEWAVSRIHDLENSGVSDPVSYFNNEMADWWLAPGGMMEEEADFVGIARAIEERWYN